MVSSCLVQLFTVDLLNEFEWSERIIIASESFVDSFRCGRGFGAIQTTPNSIVYSDVKEEQIKSTPLQTPPTPPLSHPKRRKRNQHEKERKSTKSAKWMADE